MQDSVHDKNDPIVACPIEEKLCGDEEVGGDKLNDDGTVLEVRELLDVDDYATECSGSLLVYHGPKQRTLESLKTLRLVGKGYSRIGARKLRRRTVLHVEAEGNCCWELWSKRGYNGDSKVVSSGYIAHVDFHPISIRQQKICA